MASSNDRAILLEFFHATNGPSWENNTGWDTNQSLSTWYGVTVDKIGRVVELNLRYNNLQGAIPDSIGQLTNLTELDLSFNKLTGAIPDTIGQLTNLRTVNISINQLTGAIPDSIRQLTNLRTMNLYNNQLTVIGEEAARALQRLPDQDIDLKYNPWRKPPADVVERGSAAIVDYWEAIARSGAIVSWKLKVVLVGAVRAGKTSLVNGMIHGKPNLCHVDDRTKGVDVHLSEPCKLDDARMLELVFWDFAGHSEYYSTHQAFLSKGALHLLVVDLKRFADEVSVRGELVDVWLDALQCRVPGSSVLVVATQIDRCAGDLETKLRGLQERVESHLNAQREELERVERTNTTSSDIQRGLILHGIEIVSSARSKSLIDLRLELSKLVYSKRNMFPSLGLVRPVSWARVSAMLDAMRSGKDPILQAFRVGTVEQDQRNVDTGTAGVKFLHRTGAIEEWRKVVRALKLETEVGSTMWDWAVRMVTYYLGSTMWDRAVVMPKYCLKPTVRYIAVVMLMYYLGPTMRSSLVPALISYLGSVMGDRAMRVLTQYLGSTMRYMAVVMPTTVLKVAMWYIALVMLTYILGSTMWYIAVVMLTYNLGSNMWDIAMGIPTGSRDTERSGKNAVFEDAVDGLVREGTILDSGEVLYLEPTWINDLLRAILDHDLADIMKEDFWKKKLKAFSGTDRNIYFHLKNIHDNFPSTGILTVRYLRFLWRDVPEINDRALFQSLLVTMSRHGVIFQGNPFETGREHSVNGPDDGAELFVPLHLPSKILVSDLKDLESLLKRQFRKEMVYEIDQTYVPPGLLGLLMARFLRCESVEFHKCWGRGTAFTLGEVLVLLHLNSPSRENEEARITVNVFGERFVSEVNEVMKTIEHEILGMFDEYFGGLYLGPKKGYPRIFAGISVSDEISNAVITRIDGLQSHLDQELSVLLQILDVLEDNLGDVAKSCHTGLAWLNELQPLQVSCPRLVIVRPAAAKVSVGKKRSLRAMMEGIGRRAKNLVRKDMRLCFLCPYDFSEVPCGLDGNGYPFTMNREWVTAILPALKVTAVLAKVAIKAASGVDLPVSDFLNGAKSYLGEEVADRVLDDSVIERALDGTSGPEEGQVKTLVGEAYEELNKFIEKHKRRGTGHYVHFDKLMQPVDDGEGGKVWVSKDNVELWRKACAKKARP